MLDTAYKHFEHIDLVIANDASRIKCSVPYNIAKAAVKQLGPSTGGQSSQSTTSMSIPSIPAGLKPKFPRAIMIRLN